MKPMPGGRRCGGLTAYAVAAALLVRMACGPSRGRLRRLRAVALLAAGCVPWGRARPAEDRGEPPCGPDAGEADPIERPLTGIRVLVVDDAGDSRALIAWVLRQAGAATESVCNGAEAVRRVQRGGVDAVVIDVNMPVLDGVAAANMMRRSGFTGGIIGMTASREGGLGAGVPGAGMLAAGMNAWVGKPVPRWRLVGLVGSLVREERRLAA